MELFFTQLIDDDKALFDEDEARHIKKAFRKRIGDQIYFTNGEGWLFQGNILDIGKKVLTASIETREAKPNSWTGSITMAFAATKNFGRIEWLIEKMVEMGVDCIIPLETDHSERRKWKMDRIHRIIRSAIKQSQKCQLPKVENPISFRNLCEKGYPGVQFYFGHCENGIKKDLRHIELIDQNVGFCIGPEGDFSNEEIAIALDSGMQAISLGNSRLRTETAAFKVATAFQIQNDIE